MLAQSVSAVARYNCPAASSEDSLHTHACVLAARLPLARTAPVWSRAWHVVGTQQVVASLMIELQINGFQGRF